MYPTQGLVGMYNPHPDFANKERAERQQVSEDLFRVLQMAETALHLLDKEKFNARLQELCDKLKLQ